jgi:hypothetical protein
MAKLNYIIYARMKQYISYANYKVRKCHSWDGQALSHCILPLLSTSFVPEILGVFTEVCKICQPVHQDY